LSEDLVSAVLWDIVDGPRDEEPWDALQRPAADVLRPAHEWLPSPRFSDRGGPGRDLVDYLDGWFCLGLGDRDKMTPILQHEQFAYDFAGPATCSPKPSAPVQLGLAAEPLGPGAAVRVRARAVALA